MFSTIRSLSPRLQWRLESTIKSSSIFLIYMNSITSTSQWLKGCCFLIKILIIARNIHGYFHIPSQSPAATSLWRWCPNGCSSVQTTKEAALTDLKDETSASHFSTSNFQSPHQKYRKSSWRRKVWFFPIKKRQRHDCLHCWASKGVMIWSPLGRDGSSHCCATSAHPKNRIKIASSNTSFNKPIFLGGEVKRLPKPRVSENAGSQFC